MIKDAFSKFLSRGSVAHSVSIITSGTAIAQILNIATMPIFSRIFTPSDFGVLALFTAITGILVQASGLRYHLAIPLPKKDLFAKDLVVLSFLVQCTFLVFLTIVLFLTKDFLLGLVSAELLAPYWFLIPLGVGGRGLYLTLTQWAIREKEFALIARTRLTQSLWGIAAKFVLGLLGFKPLGLLLGAIASQAGGLAILGIKLIRKNGLPKAGNVRLRRVGIKYRKFPLFSTWSGVLNTLGRQLPLIMLVALYGAETGGLVAFGMQILQIPSALLGQAIGQVFLQKASMAKYEGNLAEVSLKTFEVLLQLGTFPILCLCLLAPELFNFAFGEKWYMAGEFSRILGPWLVLGFAYSPITNLFSILNKQDASLLFEIIFVICRVISIYIGYKFGGALLSIGLFSFVSFCFLLGGMFWLLHSSGNTVSKIGCVLYGTLKSAFFLLLPISVVLFYDVHFVFSLGVACIAGLLFLKTAYLKLIGLGAHDINIPRLN